MGLFTLHNCCASCLFIKSHTLSLKVDFLFQSFLVFTIYCSFACSSVGLSVCFHPIFVETAEPIRPNILADLNL